MTDRILRTALWVSVGLNTFGAALFGWAATGRQSALLPVAVSPYFAAQLGFTIALFGAVYAWLALQPRIDRPLVVVGGIGKLGFFVLTVVYCLTGELPARMAVSATPDLVLGALFLWWARVSR